MIKKLAILLIFLGGSIYILQNDIDIAKLEIRREEDSKFIAPRADLVRLASLGYHNLVADFFWLETVQYRANCGDLGIAPDQLYPRTNFITDIDPTYTSVYLFGAITLMFEDGDNDEITMLLEKCKTQCEKADFECPSYYKVLYSLGFHYYFKLGEYEKSAQNLEEAQTLSGIDYYGLLASRIRAEGGKPELAISFLENAIKQTDDENIIKKYRLRINELRTNILERDLNQFREKYEIKNGTKIKNIQDLVAPKGPLKVIPEHPLEKHSFLYDEGLGLIRSEPPVEIYVYKNMTKKE